MDVRQSHFGICRFQPMLMAHVKRRQKLHILAILTANPRATLSDFQPLAVEEEKVIWNHYTAGNIRSMNFQADPLRVLLHLEAPDKDEAQALLNDFPMVEAGLFDIDLITSGPWLPLTALFAKEIFILPSIIKDD